MDTRETIAGLLDYIGELEGEIDEARCSPACVPAARRLLDRPAADPGSKPGIALESGEFIPASEIQHHRV